MGGILHGSLLNPRMALKNMTNTNPNGWYFHPMYNPPTQLSDFGPWKFVIFPTQKKRKIPKSFKGEAIWLSNCINYLEPQTTIYK